MRRWVIGVLSACLVWFAAGPVFAAPAPSVDTVPPADVLELEDVLESVRDTHPNLELARSRVDEAEARTMAARGGFDPLVRMSGRWQPFGYYENAQFDAEVVQPTPLWGLQAYAGYRLGWGAYPIYKRELETRSGGEVRGGLVLPVWRDGPIDDRRAKIAQARLAERGARNLRTAEQIQLEREAAKAYWSWVAAGKNLQIARDLLEIARSRQEGLREQVAAGSVPRIVLVDNQRLVLDRQAKVVAAQREFREASLKLSLYLRDARERPITPDPSRLPPAFPPAAAVELAVPPQWIEQAIAQRPDLAALDAEAQSQKVEVRLTRNRRAPAVNFHALASKDFGDGAEDLAPAELVVGVTFEVPLLLRQARGEARAASAELSQINAKRRALRDKIGAEVQEAHAQLLAARVRVDLAREQLDAAEELAEAERELLRQGAGDLLAVNLRELAAADAAILEVDALAAYHRARADLAAVLGGSS